MKSGENRTWTARLAKRLAKSMVIMLLSVLLFMGLVASTASAVTGEEYAVQNEAGQIAFIIGFGCLIIIGILYYGADIYFFDSALGIIFVVVVILIFTIPLILGAVVWAEGEGDDKDVTTPPPVAIEWTIQAAADLDVAGNTYPASPFTAIDTAIGGTTGEWAAGDAGYVDDTDKEVTVSVHVDTDLNDDQALWMEPNAIIVEFSLIKLKEGPKSDQGNIVTQQYYGRIDSIDGPVPQAKDNESTIQEWFYTDSVGRHHIGWQDEGNNWLEACEEYRGTSLPVGASCGPVPLGTDDTTGDAVAAIGSGGVRIFWVWEDRGPFSWYAQDGDTWSLTFSIGSETDWHTYTFIAYYTESATNNS